MVRRRHSLEVMDVRHGKSSMGNVDQRAAGVRRLIFFEMRDAAAPAFKRTYIGQCAETLRPSNQSHVLSAAWTQRQLGPRAFSIHDELGSARYMRGSVGFLCLVEHSLAVVEARGHTTKLGRKREPMAHSSTTNEWATGLLPRAATSAKSAQTWVASRAHCMLRAPNHHCFIAPLWSIRQSVQNGHSCVALLRIRRTCS